MLRNEKKKEENNQSGITLVVTVIILLILAGVAMSLITGEGGLFARANHAGYRYNDVSYNEAVRYNELDTLMMQYIGDGKNEGDGQGGDQGENPVVQPTVHEPVSPEPTTFRSTVNATNVTLTVMPESVGEAGTTYQYQIDEGTWVSPVIATETTYTFTGLTPVSEHTVNVRIGDTAQTAQTITTGSQKTMKEVSTLADAIKYSASPIAVTDETYSGTYKELTTSDGTVKVPVGFTVRYDSATTVAGGIVVADQKDNQWVWIPVDSTNNPYIRRTFTTNQSWDTTDTTAINRTVSGTVYHWTETMDSVEASATTNGGYYIGRYEAGVEGASAMRTIETAPQAVSIKRNQVPYVYVAIDSTKAGSGKGNILDLCTGIKGTSAGNYKSGIETKLCSSYAWDTAINFIEKTVANYGNSSPQGNYQDTAFSGGTTSEDMKVIKTGLTTSVCNIYDMGGNCWEYTTESCSQTTNPYAHRGGSYATTITARSRTSRLW